MSAALEKLEKFSNLLGEFYRQSARDLPWRHPEADGTFDPYKILVSEMMLQQTQVQRVVPKYEQFLAVFPTLKALSEAPLGDVIGTWQGLGYNRRARYLRDACDIIMKQYDGRFPQSIETLTTLPGIGHNTAAAILVYAYNQPHVFVETNIRTVFIHHFFDNAETVTDKNILPLIEQTMDRKNPRLFYWALMDYGTHLKQTTGNASRRSAGYRKQSAFEGSLRQLRGVILRELQAGSVSTLELEKRCADTRFKQALGSLIKDGLVVDKAGIVTIAS